MTAEEQLLQTMPEKWRKVLKELPAVAVCPHGAGWLVVHQLGASLSPYSVVMWKNGEPGWEEIYESLEEAMAFYMAECAKREA